jgi:hypothetical protein
MVVDIIWPFILKQVDQIGAADVQLAEARSGIDVALVPGGEVIYYQDVIPL